MIHPAADLTGTIIAQKYKLVKLLGAGGMGTVYQAQDLLVNRIVALKVLKSETDNEEAVRRFQREATIAARIDSPYCVGLLDFGVDDGRPYLVMPYVDGRSISEVIKSGPLPPPVAVDIFMQICDGLDAAHSKGVVHRDIKPSNVILVPRDESYMVKIVDFGIAKLREPDATAAPTMTATGEFLGSPQYMSPEQCEGLPADDRSDIYSLGILMYETLSGEPPFKDSNVFAIIEKHRKSLPEPLYLDVSKKTAALLQSIVFRCLEKRPSDRYTKMADLKNDLEKARSFFSGNAGFVLLSLGLSFPRKALRTIFVGVTIAIFIAASLLMVAMFGSGFLADMPIDKRQIALSLPAPPVLSEAVKEERAKGLEAKVSTIKNLYGASSESYYKICETAGDFYKGQNDPTKAMQYYGPAAVCLSALGLQQSVETANLYIKEAECCIPVRYELAFQRDRLDEARSILSPLMTNDDFALAQYITATCLQATAELKLAAVRDGHAVVHLNAAETLYRSAVNLCVGRVLDKHVFYPLYLIPALTEAGDYFYYRAKTATDSDAVDKAIIYGRAAYKVAQRQAEANAEYKLASVSCWNRLGMLEIKARDFNLAVDYFNLALRLLNETALTENVYRAKILYNLADAYLLQHAWANWLNTKVEICKLPRSF